MAQPAVGHYVLARPVRLSADTVARLAGIHPDLLRRFVALGLLDATRDSAGELWFGETAVPAIARIQRLRAGLPLNYAAIGLVTDLLDRIARLEAAQRTVTQGSQRPWT